MYTDGQLDGQIDRDDADINLFDALGAVNPPDTALGTMTASGLLLTLMRDAENDGIAPKMTTSAFGSKNYYTCCLRFPRILLGANPVHRRIERVREDGEA